MLRRHNYALLILFLSLFRSPVFPQNPEQTSNCEMHVFLPVTEKTAVDAVFEKSQSFVIQMNLGMGYESLILVSRDKANKLLTNPENINAAARQSPEGIMVDVYGIPCHSGKVKVSGHSPQIHSLDTVIPEGVFSFEFPTPMRKADDFIYIDVLGKKVLKFIKERTADSCEFYLTLPFGNGSGDAVQEDGSPSIASYAVSLPLSAEWESENGLKNTGLIVVAKEQIKPLVSHPDKMSASLTKITNEGTVALTVKVAACYGFLITVAAYAQQPSASFEDIQSSKEISLLRFDGMKAVKEHKEDEVIGKLFINIATKEIRAEMKKKGEAKTKPPVTLWEAPVEKEQVNKERLKKELVEEGEFPDKFKNISPHKKALKFAGNFSVEKKGATDIVTDKGVLYFTTGTSQTLELLDFKDRKAPKHIATFFYPEIVTENAQKGLFHYSEYAKVQISDKHAFVLNAGFGVKDDLLVLDIADTTSPTLITSYDTKSEPIAIHVESNYIYLVTQKDFQVLDASNPEKLMLVGDYAFNLGSDAIIFDMKIKNNYAFIGGHKLGLLVLDVTDPQKPTKVFHWEGSITALEIYHNYLFCSEIEVKGKDASATIRIFDSEEPASLQRLNSAIPLDKNEIGMRLYAEDNKLYAALAAFSPQGKSSGAANKKGNHVLKVFDVGDISNAKLIDGYAVSEPVRVNAFYKKGKQVYLGTTEGQGHGILVLEED